MFKKGVKIVPIIRSNHKDLIATMLAEYKPNQEIMKAVKEKFDVNIRPFQIYSVNKQRKTDIIRLRSMYLKDLMSIPIAQKRIRLERLEKLFNNCSYLKDKRARIREAVNCLSRAQEEIEGKTKLGDTFINQEQNFMFSDMTTAEILKEQKAILSRMKKIQIPIDLSKKKPINVKEVT
jgi:hypothetical protein